MPFSERAKTIALAIVKIFETSKPWGDYSAVAVLKDGAGISYGISQFTHKSSLAAVLRRYEKLGGELPNAITDWRNAIENPTKANIAALSKDTTLKNALKKLGKDELMQRAQREIAFEKYLKPAMDAAEGSDFVYPLSLSVIYDSMNHGSYAKIRDRVKIDPPGNGSMKPDEFERLWIKQYVLERDKWLENHSNPQLRVTDYRTDFFLAQIARNNWNLELPMVVHGYKLTEETLFPHGISKDSAAEQVVQPTNEHTAQSSLENGTQSALTNPPPTNNEQVVEAKQTESTPKGEIELQTKNEQSVTESAKVTSPSPYMELGFWGVIKRDLAAATGGNLSLSGLAEYAQQASGWPEWVVAIIQRLAVGVLIATLGYFVFRVVHYLADTWKKNQKTKMEAEAATSTVRKDIEWVEAPAGTSVVPQGSK